MNNRGWEQLARQKDPFPKKIPLRLVRFFSLGLLLKIFPKKVIPPKQLTTMGFLPRMNSREWEQRHAKIPERQCVISPAHKFPQKFDEIQKCPKQLDSHWLSLKAKR
jgi:hypothetical protein